MLYFSNFNDVAWIITGIIVTNTAMVNRIRIQVLSQVTAHLANAIASYAAHAHAGEESNYDQAAPETQVDLEYHRASLPHEVWSLPSAEMRHSTLCICRPFGPLTEHAIGSRSGPARHRAGPSCSRWAAAIRPLNCIADLGHGGRLLTSSPVRKLSSPQFGLAV